MNISKPTFEGLLDYLHYQYPATNGDIMLAEFCQKIKELDERSTKAEQYMKRSGCLLADFEKAQKELAQLREEALGSFTHTKLVLSSFVQGQRPEWWLSSEPEKLAETEIKRLEQLEKELAMFTTQ
jgi:hypothetical protein